MAVRALPIETEATPPVAAPRLDAVRATAPPSPLAILLHPLRHRWTRKELEQAWGQGLFSPDAKLELIEG